VIVRLVNEKNRCVVPPTLLIAPTSVVGFNGIAKFALTAMVHHGGDRIKQSAEFKRSRKTS